MARPDIWLHDLLVGIDRLHVGDDATARVVREMLQLDHLEIKASASLEGAWGEKAQATVTPRTREEVLPPPPPRETQVVQEQAPTAAAEIQEVQLLPLTGAAQQAREPSWFAAVPALEKSNDVKAPATLRLPLFPKRQSRGLLAAALATWGDNGTPDIPLLVEMIARMHPVHVVPELTGPTLRRGAQVLVDTSLAMAPFRLDVEHLLTQIDRLVAKGALRVIQFKGCPTRVRAPIGALDDAPGWRVPAPGTPIFVLTDLGIGGPALNRDRAAPAEWLRFADEARAAGCSVTALVPYAAARWPRALARQMRLIHWDRRTSASAIRRNALSRRSGSHEGRAG